VLAVAAPRETRRGNGVVRRTIKALAAADGPIGVGDIDLAVERLFSRSARRETVRFCLRKGLAKVRGPI
jgi:hypothetical protein